MPPSGLLNISHGERKNGVKPLIIPQPQISQYGNNRDYGQGNQGFGRGQQISQGPQSNPINKNSTGWTSYSDLKKSVSQPGHDSINYGLQQAGNQGYQDNRGSYSNLQNKGREQKAYDGVGGWSPVGGDRNQGGHQSYGRGQGHQGQQSYGRGQGHGQSQGYGRDQGMQQEAYGQGQPQAYGRGQLRRQDYEAGQQNWSRGQSDNQSNKKQVYSANRLQQIWSDRKSKTKSIKFTYLYPPTYLNVHIKSACTSS